MATVKFGPGTIKRQYNLSVAETPVGLPAERLTGHNGELIQHAIARVTGASVRAGMDGLITVSATSGFPLAANDTLEIEGHANLKALLFHQDSGAATIQFILW